MTSSPTIVNSPRRLQLPVPRDRSSSSRQRLSLQRGSAYLQDLVSRQREQQGYDREYKDALLKGEVGNGVRTWYSSYTTIDWLHDQCKEDWRISRLRALRGIRGFLANQWDRLQGWVAVIIIGFCTAVIAAGIVAFEMWLFDVKGGYCSTAWWRAKRFCTCPISQDATLVASSSSISSLVASTVRSHTSRKLGAMSSNAFMQTWSKPKLEDGEIPCDAWREWGQLLDGNGTRAVQWGLEYGLYIVLAVCFATFASTLTIYLSASTSVVSNKDNNPNKLPPVVQPGGSNSFNDTEEGDDHARSRLPRSASYQSYGSVNFSPRAASRARFAHSASSSMSTPLLAQSMMEENGGGKASMAAPHAAGKQEQFAGPTVVPRKVMYFAAGSGIPEIKTLLSGFVIRGYLGAWTLVAKAIGLCFAVGSGLSLGKEGPMVHIASCVGNITSRLFPKFDRNEAKRRELLSAACAAGVAVAFGAPVGGVLFSLEEVSYFFPPKVMFRSFVCAMIAAVTLKLLDPFGSGKIVLFEVTYDQDFHWIELFGFAFLGIFGGLYGAYFNKANITWTKKVRNGTALKRHPILECALICLVTVAVAFFNPFTKMGGTELVYEMFSECNKENSHETYCPHVPSQVWPLVRTLTYALIAKALVTVATFGIKLPAGIFIPTLAVGALFGRISGLVVEYAYSQHSESALFGFCRSSGPLPAPFGQACVLPGIWAMVGAAATLTGVTRTTVSLAVIMFELTGTLTYVTPVMIAVLFAKTVGDAIETKSIYDLVIESNQLPYLDAKEEHLLRGSVLDVVDVDAPYISLDRDNTVNTVEDQLFESKGLVTGFPIIRDDDGARLQGYVGYDELEEAIRKYHESSEFDEPQTPCTFRDTSARVHLRTSSEDEQGHHNRNELNLGYFTDRAPVTVSSRAPLQLLHQLFVKLGVRYIAVQDERGCYVGIIEKNRWLGYLHWLQENHE